ncbi:MAG: NYN domain-containing protein [Acidobacteria bacterium]|nr:NYN domain-containing protein [Acidobacteriota bacterium]
MDSIEQIAVFVDIENVIGFCNELRLPVDLADVLEKLKEEGRITVRRSFGDITKALSATGQIRETDNVRRMLRDNLFFHEDIPYVSQFKNSADMRLAVEALHTAFTLPSISKFAIVSGDSDYVPLFLKLREQSKSVIGITGSDKRTAIIYRNACDSLFYFEDLTGLSISNAQLDPAPPTSGDIAGQDAPDEEAKVDYQVLKDEYASLLVKSIQVLQQLGKAATPSALHPQMRQLQADFDYERAGFTSFNELVRFAETQNMIVVEQENNDLQISLPAQAIDAKQVVSTAQYRLYLQERLKCQLPAVDLLNVISEQAFAQIGFSQDDGVFYCGTFPTMLPTNSCIRILMWLSPRFINIFILYTVQGALFLNLRHMVSLIQRLKGSTLKKTSGTIILSPLKFG